MWPPAWVLFPNHPSPTVSPNTSPLTIAISYRLLTRPLALAAATLVLAHGSCGRLPCISCAPPTGHCAAFHGGLLYLRPRNADVSYAVPINGPIIGPPANNPIQVGGIGIVDPDYESAFVAGLNYALDCDTSLAASYMRFDSNTRDSIQTAAPNVLRSLVAHPSTASAATDFLQASAHLGIDFDLADVAIRQLWFAQDYFSLNYVWGARYAKLQQQFASEFVNNGVENVGTDVDFDGGGIRFGLEAERMSRHTRFGVYAKGAASFVAGRFRASYLQQADLDPIVVQTNWEAGRIVPILDVELGISWTSCSNHWHFRAGYVFSGWYNVAKTEDFISSVQQNDFRGLEETLTFDGLLAQAELRF